MTSSPFVFSPANAQHIGDDGDDEEEKENEDWGVDDDNDTNQDDEDDTLYADNGDFSCWNISLNWRWMIVQMARFLPPTNCSSGD